MAIAAKFLQHDIFVLAHNTDGQQNFHCSLFRPSTTTREKKCTKPASKLLCNSTNALQRSVKKVKVQGNNCVGSISSPEAWSLSHWNGDAAALRDRLAGMLISEDQHGHSQLLSLIHLSREVLLQWQAVAEKKRQNDQEKQLVLMSNLDTRNSSALAPSVHSFQLAGCPQPPIWQIMRTKSQQELPEGATAMQDAGSPALTAYLLDTRDS
ncbi:hypothetical protein KXD40_008533 [Peronospora effusa]|nr:hypothetical protein KXD40_008533 [Peronospora effusa]